MSNIIFTTGNEGNKVSIHPRLNKFSSWYSGCLNKASCGFEMPNPHEALFFLLKNQFARSGHRSPRNKPARPLASHRVRGK